MADGYFLSEQDRDKMKAAVDSALGNTIRSRPTAQELMDAAPSAFIVKGEIVDDFIDVYRIIETDTDVFEYEQVLLPDDEPFKIKIKTLQDLEVDLFYPARKDKHGSYIVGGCL